MHHHFCVLRLRYILAVLSGWMLVVPAMSQEQRPWEEWFAELSTADDMEREDWEATYEMLCEMEQTPIDLNSATREELSRLPFLSERQVEDIQAYVYSYGGMKTLGELAMIPSIDYSTRQLLNYFVCCREQPVATVPRMDNILKYGRHEVMATARVPFYERRGDKDGYLGYPYRHSLRYQFRYGSRLKVGVTGSQDAGEPFFGSHNKMGYDDYSLYAEAHGLGRLTSLVVGRYRASFGMGLVMSNSFSMGKLASLSSLGKRSQGLQAHVSRQTADYLQGAAATVQVVKGLDMSVFVSYRMADATLGHGDSTITTIVTTGYHRTETEMAKKNNFSETTAGTNLRFFSRGFHVGATGVYTAYDKDLAPDITKRYRMYDPTGRRFWNASIDYGYTGHRIAFRGEAATGDCQALATINTMSYAPCPTLSLMAIHRFYGKRYHAVRANSLSEGGDVRNENGVYAGVRWQATPYLRLSAYTDYAYFAAARYQAQVSSDAWDHLVQAQYDNKRLSLTARYRLKRRGYDNTEKTALITKTSHQARLGVGAVMGKWRFSSVADMTSVDFEGKHQGWMLSQNVGYTCRWLRVNACVGYFHTDDYESRLYGYEQGVLYAYSYHAFSGEGCRWALMARADINSHLMLIAHLSTTNYFDRSSISSGLQQIDRSSQTDLEVQLRWRF